MKLNFAIKNPSSFILDNLECVCPLLGTIVFASQKCHQTFCAVCLHFFRKISSMDTFFYHSCRVSALNVMQVGQQVYLEVSGGLSLAGPQAGYTVVFGKVRHNSRIESWLGCM